MWELRHKFGLQLQKKERENSIISLDTAHITLKRRFYLQDTATDDDLLAALETVDPQPIAVQATKLEVFHSETQGNVLVALVEQASVLQELHNRLVEVITPYIYSDNQFERKDFTPHLSIMYEIPDSLLKEAFAYAERVMLPLSYTVTNFYVLKNIPGIQKERSIVRAYHF